MSTWFLLPFIFFVTVGLAVDDTNNDEIRLCSLGFGYFGKKAAEVAIKKNVKIVAVFTRTSHQNEDIGDILQLGYKYNVKVSSINDLDKVLKETKANICFDATQTDLHVIYNNYVILLNNRVNILSLAEQHVFPYSIDGDYYNKINQLAIDNDVTVFGTGFQDLYFQQFALALSSQMTFINTIDAGWYGDFNTGVAAYAPYAGLGLNAADFYGKNINNPQENVFAHLMKEWTIALSKWYCNVFNLNQISNELTIEAMINDGSEGDIYCAELDKLIETGYTIGVNVTSYSKTKENVDIYFRSELRVYNEGKRKNDIEIMFVGEPEQRKLIIPIADVENGTYIVPINRIPQIIKAKPGYYNVNEMEVGLAKYWNGVSKDQKNKDEL